MEFDLYEQGKELLRNDDNIEWIDKIICWVKKESGYNIYIFQAIVENQREMEKYYEVAPDSSYVVFPVIMKYDPAKAGKKTDFLLIFELLPTEELPIMDPRFYRAMLYFTQEN